MGSQVICDEWTISRAELRRVTNGYAGQLALHVDNTLDRAVVEAIAQCETVAQIHLIGRAHSFGNRVQIYGRIASGAGSLQYFEGQTLAKPLSAKGGTHPQPFHLAAAGTVLHRAITHASGS